LINEYTARSASGGKLIFHIFSALAEFKRYLIKERTLSGLKAATARGKVGGRAQLLDNSQITSMIDA
jgi:DNA invertase Pin-like site-specific DNA recombinase